MLANCNEEVKASIPAKVHLRIQYVDWVITLGNSVINKKVLVTKGNPNGETIYCWYLIFDSLYLVQSFIVLCLCLLCKKVRHF